MGLSDFCPYPLSIEWNGLDITLKPFDLRAMSWSERFFSLDGQCGFERMGQTLKNEHGDIARENAIVEIVFHLAGDQFKKIKIYKDGFKETTVKRDWKERLFSRPWKPLVKEKPGEPEPCMIESGFISTPEILKEEIRNHKNKVEIFNGFVDKINKIINSSFTPQEEEEEPKGGSIFNALRAQSKGARKQDQVIDWSPIYVELYSAGGMSIEQFLSLTPKQVDLLRQDIHCKRFDDNEFNAKIHGMKMKGAPVRRGQQMKFSKEDIAEFEEIHSRLTEERRIN